MCCWHSFWNFSTYIPL